MHSSHCNANKGRIIPCSVDRLEPSAWQKELSRSYRTVADMLSALGLDASLDSKNRETPFPFRVTRHFVRLMRASDPQDPLLRQVLPTDSEWQQTPGFSIDPVADVEAQLGHGVLHKYQGRALVVTTGACAIHCRYCFRRHYSYSDASLSSSQIEAMVARLGSIADLKEVILSGGDPLSLSDYRLTELIHLISQIPGLKRLRLHTRLPVVLPDRMTHQLNRLLMDNPLDASLVLHINHPNEISSELREGLRPLRESSVTLLNQSVLLKGVNDRSEVLVDLSEGLFSTGILPYYLHQLDQVQGAAHFMVERNRARQLHREMRGTLPGYLVPELVTESPGEPSKLPL